MGIMDGKLCIVTGGTAGIGYQTSLELARLGASVIIVGRNREKCRSVTQQINQLIGRQTVEYLLADLSSQAQIRSIAAEFYSRHTSLDVLVNNAGAFFLTRKQSVDGIEMTLALNHLAYFLFTNLLLEALKASPSARVVNVSSGGHLGQVVNFNNLQLTRFYNPMQAYGRSKLMNVLFTYELSRRLSGLHITANALTPGMVNTDIWRNVNRFLKPIINLFISRIGATPEQGARTSIYLASSHEVEGITGKYFVNCHPVDSDPASYDIMTAKRLWQESVRLVGLVDNLE
jgi:NAD(P)-dependent dehydrogenase (short-subunit alcohol dehydrogenase family)